MLVITFQVAGTQYALRADAVLALIPEVTLSAVPQASTWLRGVFPYRGELTPVVDLCRMIGDYDCPPRLSSRIALVRCRAPDGGLHTLGLLAEKMTEARRLPDDLSSGAPLTPLPFFGPLVLTEGKPLQFVDPHRLLQVSGLPLAEARAPARLESP